MGYQERNWWKWGKRNIFLQRLAFLFINLSRICRTRTHFIYKYVYNITSYPPPRFQPPPSPSAWINTYRMWKWKKKLLSFLMNSSIPLCFQSFHNKSITISEIDDDNGDECRINYTNCVHSSDDFVSWHSPSAQSR